MTEKVGSSLHLICQNASHLSGEKQELDVVPFSIVAQQARAPSDICRHAHLKPVLRWILGLWNHPWTAVAMKNV